MCDQRPKATVPWGLPAPVDAVLDAFRITFE